MREGLTEAVLALSGGFEVEADDGAVGVVETPLFPPDRAEPDFLVVRVGRVHPRRPIVSTALVESVDLQTRTIHVRGLRSDILRLPERLPLAI